MEGIMSRHRGSLSIISKISVLIVLFVSLVSFVWAASGLNPGKSRWSIKTSVPENVDLAQAKEVDLSALIALEAPSDVKKNDPRYQDKRIPKFENSLNLKEGDIISVEGWLHLVALENDSKYHRDGDYHIQISGSRDSGDNCLIVEVPRPEKAFVDSAEIRKTSEKVRAFIKNKLLRGKEPSTSGSVMQHPPYVKVTGQLFFDDAHVGDPARGKKKMKAATLWEIHPVTDMSFARPTGK
jgi:hypothetical protein